MIDLDQSWNRLGNRLPVRSGRLENITGPVRSVTGRLELELKPVKNRWKPVKTGEFFLKADFLKKRFSEMKQFASPCKRNLTYKSIESNLKTSDENNICLEHLFIYSG